MGTLRHRYQVYAQILRGASHSFTSFRMTLWFCSEALEKGKHAERPHLPGLTSLVITPLEADAVDG